MKWRSLSGKWRSLSVQFWCWIVGTATGLALMVTLASHTVCTPQQNHAAHQRENWPTSLNHLVDPFSTREILLADSDKKNPEASKRDAADKQGDGGLRALLCDAKATDLGILYFTCCLVIVGWFTIRTGEHNSRQLERAYVSGGAFGDHAGSHSIRVDNYGKSRALIGTIAAVNCSKAELDAGINWEGVEHKEWRGLVLHPMHPNEDARLTVPDKGAPYLACRIWYRDISISAIPADLFTAPEIISE